MNEREVFSRLLDLIFDGPLATAKNSIKNMAMGRLDEIKYTNIVLDFSRIIENDTLSEDIRQQAKDTADFIKDALDTQNAEIIINTIEEIVKDWLTNQHMDNVDIEKFSNAFLEMILYYIGKTNPLLYNNLLAGLRINKLKLRVNKLEQELKKIKTFLAEERMVNDLKAYLDATPKPIFNFKKIISNSREGEIAEITKQFQNNQRIVFLYGAPGIGKTTLAKLYANKSYHQKVFFLTYTQNIEHTLENLISDTNIKTDYKNILDYFQTLPTEEKKTTLLIIDNFNDDFLYANNLTYDNELNASTFQALINCGINILVTTRINVQNYHINVNTLSDADIKQLFLSHCKDATDNDTRIDDLIKLVNGNTLLTILLAHIWERSNEERKNNLLKQLDEGNMAENPTNIPIEINGGNSFGTATFFSQLEKIFNFSPIINNKPKEIWMGCAALLPLSGISQDNFIAMVAANENELYDLINRNWISLEDGRISLHAGIREVIRKHTEIVNYENCSTYCTAIGNMLDMDNSENDLHKRIPWYKYGAEIYKIFKNVNNPQLLWLFYNLSDVCDYLKDKELANELVGTILRQIESFEGNSSRISRILSGIAYSQIQSAKTLQDLDSPKNLLKKADENLPEKPSETEERILYVEAKGRIISNEGAFLQKEAAILKNNSINKYKESKQKHENAIKYRKLELTDLINQMDNQIEQKLNHDLAKSYKNYATECFHLGEYEEAIEKHKQSIKIFQELNQKSDCALSYFLLTGCFIELYKSTLICHEEYLTDIMDHYMKVLTVLWEDNSNWKSYLKSFQTIHTIINFDRRYSKFQETAEDLQSAITEFKQSNNIHIED